MIFALVWVIKQRAVVEASWNVMAHAQKPDFVFRRNGRVHLNRRGRQFSRLLAVEVCASAVVMLDTSCYEVVWRVLATHSIRQFPLHFPSRASPCAITFHLESNSLKMFEDNLSVPSSRDHNFNYFSIIDPWRWVPKCCPETSVRNYHCLLRNNPEERSSSLLRVGSLNSRIFNLWHRASSI